MFFAKNGNHATTATRAQGYYIVHYGTPTRPPYYARRRPNCSSKSFKIQENYHNEP